MLKTVKVVREIAKLEQKVEMAETVKVIIIMKFILIYREALLLMIK